MAAKSDIMAFIRCKAKASHVVLDAWQTSEKKKRSNSKFIQPFNNRTENDGRG